MKRLPGFFFLFNILIFIYFFKDETIETHACAFLTLNIFAICRVPTFMRRQPFIVISEKCLALVVLNENVDTNQMDTAKIF